jgi:hypothetical protein
MYLTMLDFLLQFVALTSSFVSEVSVTHFLISLLGFGRAKLSGQDMARGESQQCPLQDGGPHGCHGRAAADVDIRRLRPQSQNFVLLLLFVCVFCVYYFAR